MPRKPKFIPGPSKLSKILANLKQEPHPQLLNIRALRLTLAARNDHFGARHFVKEDLPRIRYHNAAVDIEVNKMAKSREDAWKPEMVVEFADGRSQTLDLDKKWSSTILQELLDLAGGPIWSRWKKQRAAAGLPVLDPPVPKPQAPKASAQDPFFLPNRPKTGAAAVLP
ncbi:hypothetical protein BKA93DRAFT_739476 [Sparassis latifolia]|uniref:Ribosomal protein/NADH dehydrogenase domain-containing protein n=1 Tax=Sparassis crispa TaxID=139825 RepID=A0A401G8Y2_9APHY|nr:predicted protein [Sparassis crispa]GBE78617.1 predicted protein [Sparassis crispa]